MACRRELSFYRDLLDKPIVDRDGAPVGALSDLATGPSPPGTIQRLVIRPPRARPGACPLVVPWTAVAAVELRSIRLREARADLVPAPLAGGAILLRRHVMDQQVVDCRGAKLQRVNDITVGLCEEHLRLRAVDTGLHGFLTRLGHRWGLLAVLRPVHRRLRRREIGWEFVDRVEPARGHVRLRLSRDEVPTAPRPEAV
jgi:sporulation protein YlmC with PRC-barrel domain